MYKNIDQSYVNALCEREAEAQLIIDTLLENHKRILGTLSHEIGNPLAYLFSSTQLIEEHHNELSSDKHWISMKEELSYMKVLLEQLSSYNNSNVVQLETVDMYDFLGSIVLTFADSITQDKIMFTSQIPPLPSISIDKYKMKQVLINLLKNAKEACSSGDEIRLSVSFDDLWLSIRIQDYGCGIAPHHLDHIFEPFHTNKQEGTGLGLCVSRDIILAHEGNISVASTEGTGTTFTIKLPLD